jgi:hypothetical protein
MKNWIKENILLLAGISIGSIAGFIYWYNVGCSNGKCLMKSNPYYMTVYGGLLGGLFFSLFKNQTK